ncbi:MAG: Cyclohexadienyl dehydratase [Chlamydiae bacterium]|nr:Cyclohexadienyl dehydratase [Chlamydiota bacterium]
MAFPLQMAVATLLGMFVGLFLGDRAGVLGPYASAYIMILKVTAIPYLIVAIIYGVGQSNRAQAMQILKKGSLFVGLALLVNIAIIYLIRWTFPAAESSHPASYVTRDVPTLNVAKLLIPENIFYDLSNNIIPAVVVFSLLIGIALMQLADKQAAMSALNTTLEALTKVTRWISRITPIGTFLIMANQVGTVQISTIKQMGTYIILYVLGTCAVTFWIAPRLASMLTPMKAYQWLKNLIPVLVLAYTTNLVIVCLPYIINIVRRETQMLYPKDENVQNQIQGTVSIIFNIPLGSIFTAAFIFFVSVFYSTPLAIKGQIELFSISFLTSLGAVGLGSWINSLTFILDALALPVDAVNLYLTSIPFTAGFQSMVSVMLIATLAFIITLAGRGLIMWQWKRLIFHSAFVVLPILLVFGTIKYLDPLPRIKNQAKSIYDLEIESDAIVKVYSPGETPPAGAENSEGTALSRVIDSKRLRIGYDPNLPPFCFYNRNHKLVGYDVAYAYQLAYALGCDRIEFIPLNHSRIGAQLDEGLFDIAMSAISVSEERLKRMCFPNPYLEAKTVFVTKDKDRHRLANIETVKADRTLTIAVLVNTAYEGIAYSEFPYHDIVLLDSYEDFDRSGVPAADILIWEEPEAIVWIVSHTKYHVVYPKPSLGNENLGYPIKRVDLELLCYLNSWMTLKESDGFKKQQYNLWILGKTQEAAPPEPRWSILDNLLLPRKANEED